MKKLMKSLLITGICASIMASGFAFADTDTTESKGGRGEMGQGRPGHERMTEEEREAHQEEREAKREERQAEITDLVDTYASDLADDFEGAFAESEDLHTQMEALKEANRPSDEEREAMKETIEALKEKVENGEMTREEAKEEISALRPEKGQRGQKGQGSDEDREARKAEGEAKREAFETAIEEGDADTIVECLEEILNRIQEKNVEMAAKIAEMQ